MATTGQVLVAVFVLAVFIIGLAILTYRLRYLNLTDEQVRHKEIIETQIADTKPNRWSIPTELWDESQFRGQLGQMFDPAFDSPTDEPSIFDAYRSVKGSIAETFAPLAWVPKFSRWLAEEAFLLLIAGGIATISVSALTEYLEGVADYPSPERLVSATERVLTMGFEIILQFPYLSDVAALTFAYTLVMWQLLYENWHITGVFLLVGAVLIAVLHRDVPDEIETEIVARNRRTAIGIVAGVLSVWTVGVLPATVGSLAGLPRTGAAIGFILAFFLTLALFAVGVRLYIRKLVRRVEKRGFKFHGTLLYLLSRRVFGTVGILAAPIIVIYWLRLFYTGQLFEFVGAFASAHPYTQALIALTLGLVVAGVAWALRDAIPDVKDAVSNVLADRAARAVLFGYGAPTGVFIFAVMIGAGFRFPLPLALTVGLIAAIVSRLLWEAFLRVKYRTKTMERQDRIPRYIKITARRLHDDDGETIYFATVNGEELAHRDKAELVDAMVAHANARQDGEDPPATVAGWFARNCTRLGIVSVDETLKKLRRKVRRVTFGKLRKNGNRMEVEELEEELSDFPDWLVDQMLTKWEWSGSGEHSLHRRGDYYTSPQSTKQDSLLPFL